MAAGPRRAPGRLEVARSKGMPRMATSGVLCAHLARHAQECRACGVGLFRCDRGRRQQTARLHSSSPSRCYEMSAGQHLIGFRPCTPMGRPLPVSSADIEPEVEKGVKVSASRQISASRPTVVRQWALAFPAGQARQGMFDQNLDRKRRIAPSYRGSFSVADQGQGSRARADAARHRDQFRSA